MVEWLERLDYGAESLRKVVSSRLALTSLTPTALSAIKLWETFTFLKMLEAF